jgi:hypothetical protein
MIRWFSRQSVQSRLLIIFSSLVLLGAIGLGIGVLAVTNLSSRVEQGLAQAEAIQQFASLDRLILDQQIALFQFAQSGEPVYLRRYSNLELDLNYHFRLAMSHDLDTGTLIALQNIAAELERLDRQADPLLYAIETG